MIPERPVIPERPAALKPTPKLRSTLEGSKNYENVSMSSSENLSGDERTLQRTQMYSIEKQQIAIIQVNEQKRERSREKRSKERDKSADVPEVNHVMDDEEIVKVVEVVEVEINPVESKRPSSLSGRTFFVCFLKFPFFFIFTFIGFPFFFFLFCAEEKYHL